MTIISHRGNLNGPNPFKENNPHSILEALKVFDVEIDVWIHNGQLWLGHDNPHTKIDLNFLIENKDKLWVHCKNIQALEFLKNEDLNCFGHDKDNFVLTSKLKIFTKPGFFQTDSSVSVMPELAEDKNLSNFAVCTDYPVKYKKLYDSFNHIVR